MSIPNMLHVVVQAKADFPFAWAQAHNGSVYTHDFIQLLAARLHSMDANWGLLGQYGNVGDLAEDVVCYLGEGPGYDTITGQPISAFDVIAVAGGPSPTPVWRFVDQGGGAAWVKPWSGDAPPAPVPAPPAPPLPGVPGRDEALDELIWLDGYYAAPDGLQRPQGLSLDGKPDFEGVAAWYLDVYQRARLAGQTREQARAAYVHQLRRSFEWLTKHPGETP